MSSTEEVERRFKQDYSPAFPIAHPVERIKKEQLAIRQEYQGKEIEAKSFTSHNINVCGRVYEYFTCDTPEQSRRIGSRIILKGCDIINAVILFLCYLSGALILFRLFVILTKWKGCNIIDAVISYLDKLTWNLIFCHLITKLSIGDGIISAFSSLDSSVRD